MGRVVFLFILLSTACSGTSGGGNRSATSMLYYFLEFQTPTYYEEVSHIFRSNCSSCHQQGEIAPFPLESYQDAVTYSSSIRQSVTDRTMPPPGMDNSGVCQSYTDTHWLSDADIVSIQRWVDGGMPAGDSSLGEPALPAIRSLPNISATLDMGVDYTPDHHKSDDIRCFLVDTGLTEDRFMTGFELVPGAPSVVHHAILFSIDSAEQAAYAAALDSADPLPGYECPSGDSVPNSLFLAGWAPGGGASLQPAGTGLRIYGGFKQILQIHYNLTQSSYATTAFDRHTGDQLPPSDRSKMHLQLATQVEKEAIVFPVADLDMALPPGEASATTVAEFTIPEFLPSMTIYSSFPHMHLLGSSIKAERVRDGKSECIMDVPKWDFNWQGAGTYSTPLEFRAGDTIRLTCEFDTTSRTEDTVWGNGTNDEMCLNFFYATFDNQFSFPGL